MLTVEKLSNQVSTTETLTHQVNHGKTSSMVVLLMPMVWSMLTHIPFNTRDSKTSLLSEMPLEETSLELWLQQWPNPQLSKTIFLDSWMERKLMESMMDILISHFTWATLTLPHSLIFTTLKLTLTTIGNQVSVLSETDISIGKWVPTKKLDQLTCQWTKTTDHHTNISPKPSTNLNTTNSFKTRKSMSNLSDPFM